MKGVVFNLFESFIVDTFDEESWEAVLEESGNEEDVFVGPKTYEDKTFFSLVVNAVKLKSLDLQVGIKAFGRYAYPLLAKKIPSVLEKYKTPEELLLELDGIIHVEVRKLLENANPPKFTVTRKDDYLLMKYESKRNLCSFAEGLIEGLAAEFDTDVTYEQLTCTHHGAEECLLKVQFSNK